MWELIVRPVLSNEFSIVVTNEDAFGGMVPVPADDIPVVGRT